MPIIELKYLFKIFSVCYWRPFIFSLSLISTPRSSLLIAFYSENGLQEARWWCKITHWEFIHSEGSASITVEIKLICRGAAQAQCTSWSPTESSVVVPCKGMNFTTGGRSIQHIPLVFHEWPWYDQKTAGFTCLRKMEKRWYSDVVEPKITSKSTKFAFRFLTTY